MLTASATRAQINHILDLPYYAAARTNSRQSALHQLCVCEDSNHIQQVEVGRAGPATLHHEEDRLVYYIMKIGLRTSSSAREKSAFIRCSCSLQRKPQEQGTQGTYGQGGRTILNIYTGRIQRDELLTRIRLYVLQVLRRPNERQDPHSVGHFYRS